MSNTIQNTKKDSHCLDITTLSGKATTNPSMLVVDDNRNDPIVINDMDENEVENLEVNKDTT